MSILDEWIGFDTNIWIFGLRQVPEIPACAELLEHLVRLRVVLPRQVLQELHANLSERVGRLLQKHSCSNGHATRNPKRRSLKSSKSYPALGNDLSSFVSYGKKLGSD